MTVKPVEKWENERGWVTRIVTRDGREHFLFAPSSMELDQKIRDLLRSEVESPHEH